MITDRHLRRRIQRLTDEANRNASHAVQWIGLGDYAAAATSAQAASEYAAQAKGLQDALDLIETGE
jgi:HEPN domain-containing protein